MKTKFVPTLPKIPPIKYLKKYINSQWFAPQDALQRSLEASIWKYCKFTHPVLDIGIGDGQASKFIYPDKISIDVGVDKNPEGLKNAQSLGIYKKVLEADATDLPLKTSSFNSVISNSTFEHILNDEKVVAEVSRVLKKSGVFFLTCPTNHFPKMIKMIEKNLKKKRLSQANKRLAHENYHSIERWEQLLSKYNMKIVFYKFYEPYTTFSTWYKLFIFSTTKIRGKEIWSYLANSKFSVVIPKSFYKKWILTKIKKAYQEGFKTTNDFGAQIFMVVEKK